MMRRLATLALCGLLTGSGFVHGEDQPPAGKSLLLPVAGEVSTELKNRVADRVRRASREGVETVVLDLQLSSKSGFGECLGLARELARTQGSIKRKVAYVGKNLTGHGLLVALACDEIVLGETVKIGDAYAETPEIEASKPEVEAYRELAASKGRDPWLVLSMVSKEVRIFIVRTAAGGKRYAPEDKLAEIEAGARIVEKKVFKEANVRLTFSAKEARDAGLAKFLAESLREAAGLYGVAETAAVVEEAYQEKPVPCLLRLDRHLDGSVLGYVKRQLAIARERRCNLLFVEIDAISGTPDGGEGIARELSELPATIRTVAYIPQRATGPAALAAFGCREIVMGPDAKLGDYQADGKDLDRQAESLAAIAANGRFSPALVQRFVNPQLAVFRVRDRTNPSLTGFKTDKDLENPAENQKWEKAAPGPVRDKGPVLWLTTDEALQLQVAAMKIGSRDELFRQYGVDAVQPLQPGWVDALVDALTSEPGVVFLLACGLLCLYVELQFPGFLIPGVIAAVCFVLFFWSQWLAESAGALEVVLFLLGLVLLGVELFLIPGFGFVGLVGILCMMLSLVLATQTFMVPTTDAEVWQMAYGAGKVGLSLVAFLAIALALSRFMPRMKIFDRLRLAPIDPNASRAPEAESAGDFPDRNDLVGQVGEASSPLRPAGRARIGDKFFDVVTQGEFVLQGATVEVIEVHPRRIVVRQRA